MRCLPCRPNSWGSNMYYEAVATYRSSTSFPRLTPQKSAAAPPALAGYVPSMGTPIKYLKPWRGFDDAYWPTSTFISPLAHISTIPLQVRCAATVFRASKLVTHVATPAVRNVEVRVALHPAQRWAWAATSAALTRSLLQAISVARPHASSKVYP